jgi:hypothetical protein
MMATQQTERSIRIEAWRFAMEDAYQAWRYDYTCNIRQVAISNSWRLDTPEQRDLFVAAYQEVYPQGLEAFRSGSYAIADGLTKGERLFLFGKYADSRVPRERGQTEPSC